MTDRPIIFTGESVRGILAGRKTQTRRVAKLLLPGDKNYINAADSEEWRAERVKKCPYGVPGDRLWVRETWATGKSLDKLSALEIGLKCKGAGYTRVGAPLWYPDGTHRPWGDHDLQDFDGIGKNRNALFMPRWASRITLEITDIRVQRVQEITAVDCIAEGIPTRHMEIDGMPNLASAIMYISDFEALWDSINAKRGFSWESNPWVWAVSFRRLP